VATRLSRFTAGELAVAVGSKLGRGRPSKALRRDLEAAVQFAIEDGRVAVKKGKLVKA
jgi:hypothetical protein